MPDFVYRAVIQPKGSGVREVGDRLLVVGNLGVVVQVKARAAGGGTEEREIAWLHKAVAKGASQAAGSIRLLEREAVRATNGRGHSLDIGKANIDWVGLVVVDHDQPPRVFLDQPENVIVMLRRDWEFLFDQLKSTYAVVEYLHRLRGETSFELGQEPGRYYELAQADAATPPTEMDLAALGPRASQISAPQLPLAPAGTQDIDALLLLRLVMEDVATAPMQGPSDARLRPLAALDRLPVGHREMIGRFMLSRLEMARSAQPGTTLDLKRRIVSADGTLHLAFGAVSDSAPETRHVFAEWVYLRHHQVWAASEHPEELTSVGLFISPRDDDSRPWDTTMFAVAGDMGHSDADVAKLNRLFGDALISEDEERDMLRASGSA